MGVPPPRERSRARGRQDASGQPLGWGTVDDEESVRAVHRALDLGVTFFDTADTYGAGHSERVLGRALAKRRDQAVVATKRGNVFDEHTRTLTGTDDSPGYVRRALTASLRRLGTDHVDLYQLHLSDADPARAAELRDVCEELVTEGLIRSYGWSTDDPARAAVFAEGRHCTAVQHALNVLQDAPELLGTAHSLGLAAVNRSPLAMGLLGGRRAAGGGRCGGHPEQAAGLAGRVRGRIRRRSRLGRADRRAAGRPHQRRPHPRAGRARLDLGPRSAHRAHPRLPVRRAGRGERRGDGEGAAHRRAAGRDRRAARALSGPRGRVSRPDRRRTAGARTAVGRDRGDFRRPRPGGRGAVAAPVRSG